MQRSARRDLLWALDRVEDSPGDARRALRDAVGQAPDDPLVAHAAGHLAFLLRDYDHALQALARAHRLRPSAHALGRRFEIAHMLGWEREALQTVQMALEHAPASVPWWRRGLVLLGRRRDFAGALRYAARLLELPDEGRDQVVLEAVGMWLGAGDRAAAARELARVPLEAPRWDVQLEAARLAVELGAFDDARARLRRALRVEPGAAIARGRLAELAVWQGDLAEARAQAEAQLELGPSPVGERVLGAVAWLEGDAAGAAARWRRALSLDPEDAESHVWLAEAAIREGRSEGVEDHLDRAVRAAGGPPFVAHLVRLRLNASPTSPIGLGSLVIDHLRAGVRAVQPALGPDSTSAAEWHAAVGDVLAAMGGNRSTVPTYVDEGTLRLVPFGRDPRWESRRALQTLFVASEASVEAELRSLVEAFPTSSLPLAHLGELFVWTGDLVRARAELDRSIALVTGTRWSYIGLSCVDILEGDPERALATLAHGVRVMNNTEGPAVSAHRGEALRLLGRFSEARRDLEHATRAHPRRLAAWLNLGLLDADEGAPQGAERGVLALRQRAPGLLSDAARSLGEFVPRGALPPEAAVRIVREALRLMQGNRSASCISYVSPEGGRRFAIHLGETELHAYDARWIQQIRRLLA